MNKTRTRNATRVKLFCHPGVIQVDPLLRLPEAKCAAARQIPEQGPAMTMKELNLAPMSIPPLPRLNGAEGGIAHDDGFAGFEGTVTGAGPTIWGAWLVSAGCGGVSDGLIGRGAGACGAGLCPATWIMAGTASKAGGMITGIMCVLPVHFDLDVATFSSLPHWGGEAGRGGERSDLKAIDG
jgi:hypothetical protein